MDSSGAIQVRERDEMRFGEHASNLDDPVLLPVEFDLETDNPDAIVKRMRKSWILRKASQSAELPVGRPDLQEPARPQRAALIEQAGLGPQACRRGRG